MIKEGYSFGMPWSILAQDLHFTNGYERILVEMEMLKKMNGFLRRGSSVQLWCFSLRRPLGACQYPVDELPILAGLEI